MFYFALSLYIVLTSGEVPHEVTPVHVVQLVDEEELDVVPLRRNLYHQHLSTLVVGDLASFYSAQPRFVSGCMVGTIHTWENHVLRVLVFTLVAHYFVTVFFVRAFFFLALVDWCAFRHGINASSVYFFECHFRGIRLSVKERACAVLFTSQIFT